jgi:Tol biopolymer transport system component
MRGTYPDDRLRGYFNGLGLEAESAPASLRIRVDGIPEDLPVRSSWLDALRSRPVMVFAALALLVLALMAAVIVGGQPTKPHLDNLVDRTIRDRESPKALVDVGANIIAFDSGGDIYTVRPDGSGVTRLTHGSAWDYDPAWSPDGSMVAFWSQPNAAADAAGFDKTLQTALMVMNRDGSDPHVLVGGLVYLRDAPAWSPDGRHIWYTPWSASGTAIWAAGLDGKAPVALGQGATGAPVLSPDGTAIAYVVGNAIHLIGPDGNGDTAIVASGVAGIESWSPDGSRLAYLSNTSPGPIRDTWVVGRDGSGAHSLTDSTGSEAFGGWSSASGATVFSRLEPDGRYALSVADAEGKAPRQLGVTGVTGPASWAQDGKLLVARSESGLTVIDPSGQAAPVHIAGNAIAGASWSNAAPPAAAILSSLAPVTVPSGDVHRWNTTVFSVPFSIDVSSLPGAIDDQNGPSWFPGPISPKVYELRTYDYGIAAYTGSRLYSDPCHRDRGFADTGASPADLAAALAKVPGLAVESQRSIDIDRHAGVEVDFHLTTQASGCDDAQKLHLQAVDASVDETINLNGGPGGFSAQDLSDRAGVAGGDIQFRWAIIDVGGTRLVIETWIPLFSPGDLLGSFSVTQQAVDSIRFR